MQGTACRKGDFVQVFLPFSAVGSSIVLPSQVPQLKKPKKTPGLLECFVQEFLDGRRQSGDAVRAFDCLTATSDRVDMKWILCYAAQKCSYLNQLEFADWINRLQMDASDPLSGKGWELLVVLAVWAGQDIPPTLPSWQS